MRLAKSHHVCERTEPYPLLSSAFLCETCVQFPFVRSQRLCTSVASFYLPLNSAFRFSRKAFMPSF